MSLGSNRLRCRLFMISLIYVHKKIYIHIIESLEKYTAENIFTYFKYN